MTGLTPNMMLSMQGCSQGTAHSLILFLLFMNDLLYSTKNPIHSYAINATLYIQEAVQRPAQATALAYQHKSAKLATACIRQSSGAHAFEVPARPSSPSEAEQQQRREGVKGKSAKPESTDSWPELSLPKVQQKQRLSHRPLQSSENMPALAGHSHHPHEQGIRHLIYLHVPTPSGVSLKTHNTTIATSLNSDLTTIPE